MRHPGQQCRGHRENKRSRAGVWRKSYKVYKESVFLYNNKKPKATRAVVYTKHGDIASLANRFRTRRETRQRGAQGRAGERAACKRRGRGRGGLFSQHKSTGGSWSRARTGEVEGVCRCVCRCWLCVGGQGCREPRVSACPGPLAPCSSSISPEGGSGWGPRTSWANWPQRAGGNPSLESAVENRRSPLGAPILLAHAPRPAEMHTEAPEETGASGFPRASGPAGAAHSCSSGARSASHAELDGRAGASHGGGGEGRAGRTAGGGAGGGRGRARTRGAARGGHRFWQHCSLVGFCPSVVGGTLMSTTLLPGDSSWAARSAICFCDTMR